MADKPLLLRHWRSKLFSLLLATAAWFALTGRDLRTTDFVQVRVRVAAPEGVSVLLPENYQVKARFSGPSGRIKRLNDWLKDNRVVAKINLTGEVDPEQIPQGQTISQVLTFNSERFLLPEGVRLKEARPPDIQIPCQRKITKMLNVRPRYVYEKDGETIEVQPGDPTKGIVGEGYEINWNTTYCQPAAVEVSGPETILINMSYILTEPIDIGGRESHMYPRAELVDELEDENHGTVQITPHPPEGGVALVITVDPERQEKFLEGVPLCYVRPRVFPYAVASVKSAKTKNDIEAVDIRVRGPSNRVSGLTPKDERIRVAVDLRKLKDLSPGVARVIPLDITLPKGVELVGDTPNVQVKLSAIIAPDKTTENGGE